MNSFIEGLSPSETFFHAMTGRCGSIDTAIKTADSGYTSKKLIKAVEDLKVNYDFTVRNASNHIVQFAYGDDHFDPIKLEYISQIELITLNKKELERQYRFTETDQATLETFMTPEAVYETLQDEEYARILEEDYQLVVKYQNDLRYNYFRNTKVIGEIGAFSPIHLYTVIPNILVQFHIEPYHLCDMTPRYILETYNQLLKDLVQYLPEKDENWKLMFVLFKSFLSLKKIMFEYRMSRVAFDSLIAYIKKKVVQALISPGEMVGIVSAQTLGQISTQLTLNTFHFSGMASGSLVITEGLPRLREIMNLTKNLKNQNMTIYLKEEYAKDKDKAKVIQTKLGYTQIKDILSKTEILYNNDEGLTEKDEDYEFIKSYKEFTELFDIDNIPDEELSPWILRLTFDKESLMNRKILLQEVQETIKENSQNEKEIHCVFNDDSANDVVMRIKINYDENSLEFMRNFEKKITELRLRGTTGIHEVQMVETNIINYDMEGNILKEKEWMFVTNGSNMIDVLSHEAVDTTRTTTNDIIEFYEIYGIEATRELIYRELCKVFLSENPNPRHIYMLCDIMTYRGKLMSIDRHGLNKNPQIGPISKACFEEVLNNFTKAAVFSEKDTMKSVSANILAGQFCHAGTNNFNVLFDEDQLPESDDEEEEDELFVSEEKVAKLFEELYPSEEEVHSKIQEEDFHFGFGFEEEEQNVLARESRPSRIQVLENMSRVTSLNNDSNELLEEVEYDENEMVEPSYEEEENKIEEPSYEPPKPKKKIIRKPKAPAAPKAEKKSRKKA
jgi:DNA-directed RNA polymerase II subunit RPB1